MSAESLASTGTWFGVGFGLLLLPVFIWWLRGGDMESSVDDEDEEPDDVATDGNPDHGVVGTCTECGGRMVEHALTYVEDRGLVQLVCEDCGGEGRLEYVRGQQNPWENPDVREGVTDTTVEQIDWVMCLHCRGDGWVVGCIDDICHAKGHCIHDGNDPCPECHTTGYVPRVVATDGGTEGERGLYRKFEVFEFQSGRPVDEPCFVLKPESDPAAYEALLRYAEVTENEAMAADLFDWAADIEEADR